VTLAFDLLTLKVVSESRLTCATSVPILVFLSFSVLDLGQMYATDVRQTDVRRQTKAPLNAPAYWGPGHNKLCGGHNMPRPLQMVRPGDIDRITPVMGLLHLIFNLRSPSILNLGSGTEQTDDGHNASCLHALSWDGGIIISSNINITSLELGVEVRMKMCYFCYSEK